VFGLFQIGNFGGVTIAVINNSDTDASDKLLNEISANEFFAIEYIESRETGISQLTKGIIEYVLIIPREFNGISEKYISLVYTDKDTQQNAFTLLTLSRLLDTESYQDIPQPSIVTTEISIPESSYFDQVLLGLVGLGIMTNSIISIAVKISNYRNQSVLKRMLVTPLPIWKFFAAEIVSHLILAMIQAIIILAVGILAFGADITGNPIWLMAIVLLGSLVFLNIGFIMSAWTNSPSAASGMGNAIALPMIFFAGTFFSTTSLPWIMPVVAEAIPLTPMLSALREIGINNSPIQSVLPEIGILFGWVIATSAIAIKVFRFN
jgi:ABC-2 type transport system permease protein